MSGIACPAPEPYSRWRDEMATTMSVGGLLKRLTSMGMGREIQPHTPVIVLCSGLEFVVGHVEIDRAGRVVMHTIDGETFQ